MTIPFGDDMMSRRLDVTDGPQQFVAAMTKWGQAPFSCGFPTTRKWGLTPFGGARVRLAVAALIDA